MINKYNLQNRMQFPQLNKYNSLVQKHLQFPSDSFQPQTYDLHPLNPHHLRDLLSDIDQINISRSYTHRSPHPTTPTLTPNTTKSNQSSQQTLEFDLNDSRTDKSTHSERTHKISKSLIFAPLTFSKHKDTAKHKEPHIRVHYFNLPLSKHLPYSTHTKISDLINSALQLYLQDPTLDHSRIKQPQYQYYELRLHQQEDYSKADLTIPPIEHHRLVHQNMFDSLVLLAKDKPDRQEKSRKNSVEYTKPQKKNGITVFLFNELAEQLGSLTMAPTDSLQTIFDHIESNDLHHMRSYYLTQTISDTDGLPRDFQVKNLQSNKIYIKVKKYIDDCQWETKVKPIKNLIHLNKEAQPSIPLPIGLNEASQYEEFNVVKVNSMGFEQDRILGIDQTKLYNYDKSFREEKRQSSFFSKIFGKNQQTGTKKPYRLIEDIVDIKKTEKGIIVIYKQKPIQYRVADAQIRQKIARKLNFLINHSKQQKTKSKPVKY